MENVDWLMVEGNTSPNMLSLITNGYSNMKMKEKICMLAKPCIFVLDTQKMQEQCKPFCEELCSLVFSPEKVERSFELFRYNIVNGDYE
jgi:hypothetical protein